MKKCIKCKIEKTQCEFYGKARMCKQCQRDYMRHYRSKAKLDALYAYGGTKPTCTCPGCNENRLPFLCIDHIAGGGNKHRQDLCSTQKSNRDGKMSPGGGVFYRWLRKNKWPIGYQVLCHNCNIARSNGPCPVHEGE